MKSWVITATVDPTKLEGVVSGRFGGSIMFVAYSRLLRQWFWVFGGGEEKIEEPEMLFVEEEWAVANRLFTGVTRAPSRRIRKKSVEQLNLF